jgi:hypothetical protein
MGYGGEPLVRETAGEREGVLFLVNPNVNRTEEEMQSAGVGFPSSCVYQYSDSLLQDLTSAWEQDDSALLATLWDRASHVEHGSSTWNTP